MNLSYFCTVDVNYNSVHYYIVGIIFYGTKVASKLATSVTEIIKTYSPTLGSNSFTLDNLGFQIFPNPASDLIAIQCSEMFTENFNAELIDEQGRIVVTKTFLQGSTNCFFEADTLYSGIYILKISDNTISKIFKIVPLK